MRNLKERMAEANQLLAPYAVKHEGALGRVHPEPEDNLRFPFQRDRARIIHSQAFRRLQGKTQVFVAGEGDHFRTRLTHTMEVAQISRDLARALRLNEDLTECIALAHDLGHPPFGHSGEGVIDAWMRSRGGHFEHNEQSHRIVTVLEMHSDEYLGLNLQREVVDGLLKHTQHPASFEAAIVNVADEIAYTAHDCDDGLLGKLFTFADLLTVPLASQAETVRAQRGTSIRGVLIALMAEDLIATFSARMTEGGSSVSFSPAMRDAVRVLRSFLMERMYTHPSIQAPLERGKTILGLLCRHYADSPPPKILSLQRRTGGTLTEAVKDYVAGMTDAYAEEQAILLELITER